ncbi:DNA-(apurinic or apyrimidinic site) lyase [Streptomyces sp. DvalAA-14]|uniref:bifunctional DNA-formamidopyrimidine glycosylase/DNA-(apurinic or apyrimidinic site) lyase n=1 Tax=unclassified Streptomyces TaxID=2593676 RepID=UPI00081AFFA6|nr:bifunctional DNA-formamidopyrimidine glycosylase/DNA-(apurinic or apyrimidinic site) lyase [Streptomyces sp. DvalAA-14]MYS21280.1 bifunctional DNA-formamidopyrimidine glycosylase/DNA-(apurinic or apyrimidinic site) lyase [Streptomyces sp. SID4948]SCD88749.1 DNA-(apurinic or apyrimidinic site) lyase [Streptomyces sp. DvalAA-14]
MPELPEVEVVRRGLALFASGRTIEDVTVLHPRAVRRHPAGADDFAKALRGTVVGEAHRRGKYLWLPVTEDQALLAHLGMSGQFLVRPQDAAAEKHLRIRFTFADSEGTDLRFVDQRTFGGLSLHDTVPGDPELLPQPLSHIARDPIDPAFDDDAFHAALHRKRTTIKRALLDQSLISGVGNIYADEALWRTKLHYDRPTASLTRPRTAELLTHIREVMADALAAGGTSFDSMYVNINGESGFFDRSLDVYGREDQPCRRCGTPIRRRPWMNRSSYFCPHCQPVPRAAS